MSILNQVCRFKLFPKTLCPSDLGLTAKLRHILEQIVREAPLGLQVTESLAAQLTLPLIVTRDFAHALVRELGEPRQLDLRHWSKDPFIPVLFSSPQEGLDILGRSSSLRAAFARGADQVFVLMTMHRHEFEILGSELDGEIIRRDVLQSVIGFEGHTIAVVRPTIGQARAAIVGELVLYLAGLVQRRLLHAARIRKEFLDAKKLLAAQVQTLERASKEFGSRPIPGVLQDKLRQGRSTAQILEDDLARLEEHPDPETYVSMVGDVLLHPQKHLQIERVVTRVQDFNIKAQKGQGREIQFMEFKTGEEKRQAVFFASVTRDLAIVLWPDLDADPS